ncbi:MAG: cobalamin biosynthesis protein CobD [Candidatus Tectomicrobia bacterium]|uniref:Cobalamin biosynthesis protein CobD n=1 Tax=Tectimicrobiota bacterium TaxID=2528274 RepID=A0A937W1J5_UNCTE|nr:cobalamin biosynthesis protein CobD [Candidatus Tectomicrobia bacterium]
MDSGVIPLVLACLLDLVLGDPPNRYHPVAWMGRSISMARRFAPPWNPGLAFLYGAGIVGAGVLLVGSLGLVVEASLQFLPLPWYWLAEACALKTTFALRGLARAALQVRAALLAGDLERARALLSWHLVSRDTSTLTSSQVAAATVESIAENASDGIVAPLLFYAIGGLPAALIYRFLNTADAMLGYRDPEREWLGKVPARVDDLVNLLPARLTASCFLLATQCMGGPIRRAWGIWWRDAGQTASPNAGRPMSVMAGALGIELEKVGHYCLGAGQALPAARDITGAVRLLAWAMAIAVSGLSALQGLIAWLV